ncbi:GDSL-type esterase/lipase family protein [Bacillus tianshenii]|nr:GDSL-type esterase/lipase family protein [Bacillus tianshenii]
MWKKIMISLIVILLLAGLTAFYFYKQVTTPSNSMKDYLQTAHNPNEKTVVLLGDSITEGTISYDYVDDLNKAYPDKEYTFVNAGHGGDLAYHVNQRLDQVIQAKPDTVILLVGTNDILGTTTPKIKKATKKAKDLPKEPTPEWYEQQLTTIVERLKEKTDAEVAVMSPPVLTEDIGSIPYKLSKQYKEIVQEVAYEQDIEYLPLHEKQMDFYKKHRPNPTDSFHYGAKNIYQSAMKHYLLFKEWNEVSEHRGLLLTTDHIHQNARGAEMIKELVKEYLRNSE